ncbi:MAG TPA: hypothetical protein VHG08_02515 [Longimicrobium sp.]|nr:hypothetical protein [Longimicrobium sp.]
MIYGRASYTGGEAVGHFMIQRHPDPQRCMAFANDQGWWYVRTLDAGRHVFSASSSSGCASSPIVVDLAAGDTVRIDPVLVREEGWWDGSPVVRHAPEQELLDCRVAQSRWRGELGLGPPVPATWRLPTNREILVLALTAPPVQVLLGRYAPGDPVSVEFWRPWGASLEHVGGRTYAIEGNARKSREWRKFSLRVVPADIRLEGMLVDVVWEPHEFAPSKPFKSVTLEFRREGDGYVFCVPAPGEPFCYSP